jgi:hypothetical protein
MVRVAHNDAMAADILAGGVILVALVLALRVKRDDIPRFTNGLGRWFRR